MIKVKKDAKFIIVVCAAVVVVAVIFVIILKIAGGDLDVVGRGSVVSFKAVLDTIPDRVKADDSNGGWSLEAPDGTVRFVWSTNYAKSPGYDVMLELDAQPFIDAGLDVGRLPGNYTYHGGVLTVGIRPGDDDLKYDGNPAPIEAYEQMVGKYRGRINYHAAMDHYGVKLGGGNMFEWARDLSVNIVTGEAQDKDIVFVLNPEPLIAAGVDPEKTVGWVYAQVPMEDHGATVDVYKFLKPFYLK